MKTDHPLFKTRVRVPATSANLGPGFDVLGIALGLFDEVELALWKAGHRPGLSITVDGAKDIPTDANNLAYRALVRIFKAARKPLPAVELRIKVRLPVAGGLGSSSAAIVGGLVAGNAALKNRFSMQELVQMATDLEGHPDNVLPALVGGLCAGVVTKAGVKFVAWKDSTFSRNVRAVVCTPDFKVPTEKARRVLPARVDRKDAIFNAAHVALFLSAIKEKRYDLLGEAMGDRLHQPYRAKLVPGLMDVIAAARRAGAYGAALSGAGPTVLAFVSHEKAANAARAMERAFRRFRFNTQFQILRIESRGAKPF
ncbi:MAG: homoserine kinase [Elusimicrobia bacterium]|nr:homoserine kinase [Elusimicrobiota bacterium]